MSYHHSIDTALQKIRQDIARVLSPEAIVEACHQAGHQWRNRTLTPSVVIHWFIQHVLLQNTSAQHVSLLSNREFTDSAYCQGKKGAFYVNRSKVLFGMNSTGFGSVLLCNRKSD